jgi:hypothetical protein
MKTNLLLIFTVVGCLGMSCQSSRKLTGSKDPIRSPIDFSTLTTDSILSVLALHSNYSYLNAKGSFLYSDDQLNIDVKINSYLIKDSVYMIAAKKLGIEICRILITKDSVYLLDRVEQTLHTFGFESFCQKFSIPFTFSHLYQLVTSGCIIDPEATYTFIKNDDFCVMYGITSNIKSVYHLDSFSLFPKKFIASDSNRELYINTLKTTRIHGKLIPEKIQVILKNPEKNYFYFEIDWTDIKLDTIQQIKFSIPDHYTLKTH